MRACGRTRSVVPAPEEVGWSVGAYWMSEGLPYLNDLFWKLTTTMIMKVSN